MSSSGSRARSILQNAGTNIQAAFKQGISGAIRGVFIGIIAVIVVITDFFTKPLGAMIGGITGLVDALFGGIIDILNQTATTAVQSFAPGSTWAIGPLTWFFGILMLTGTLWLVSKMLSIDDTSNLVPGSFVDYPIIGRWVGTGPEQEEEED